MFLTLRRVVFLLLFLSVACLFAAGGAFAQASEAQNSKIEELLRLIDDPEVRAALEASRQSAPAAVEVPTASDISRVDTALRGHFVAMIAAAKRLPVEAGTAWRNISDAHTTEEIGLIVLLLAVFVPAFAVEWFVHQRLARRAERHEDFGAQLFAKFAPLMAFAIAGVLMFLVVGSTPMLRKIAGVILVAVVAARLIYALLAIVLDRALLAGPTPENKETGYPAPDQIRVFWRTRLAFLVGYFTTAWTILTLLPAAGFSADASQFLAYIAGLGLLAMVVEIVWNSPSPASGRLDGYARKWLLTIYWVLLWFVWAAGLTLPFWIGLYAVLLPKLLVVVGRASQSFLEAEGSRERATPFREILFARGARALVILLAVIWIAYILRVHPGVLATSSETASAIIHNTMRSVLILVAADLVWQFLKTSIDHRLALGDTLHGGTTSQASGRLRTLLPIFRNALAVLVATIAGLMILAEFGVQIGPLIAGAGIFGVAIGFGSQTLVKDIVSGIFYLMDDAFRVGEYIQSGSYKGTVEGFSLRSVRLRHHRGPVFTVPFGTLGAVQNMSRDWVIDKFVVRFPFDTNINLVKRLTKKIGADLQADEELGPIIMQTVKMKGVETIGDYGIDVSFAFMSKPGYQTSVRRRAYSMMREAFAENGIEFARPSVSVGTGGEGAAAAGAASSVLSRQKQAEQEKA